MALDSSLSRSRSKLPPQPCPAPLVRSQFPHSTSTASPQLTNPLRRLGAPQPHPQALLPAPRLVERLPADKHLCDGETPPPEVPVVYLMPVHLSVLRLLVAH